MTTKTSSIAIMGNCFSTPSAPHAHHPSGPGPSPGIERLPAAPVMVPGLQTDPGLAFPGLNNHGHGRPSMDHGTGPRPLPDPSEATPSNVKVSYLKQNL